FRPGSFDVFFRRHGGASAAALRQPLLDGPSRARSTDEDGRGSPLSLSCACRSFGPRMFGASGRVSFRGGVRRGYRIEPIDYAQAAFDGFDRLLNPAGDARNLWFGDR